MIFNSKNRASRQTTVKSQAHANCVECVKIKRCGWVTQGTDVCKWFWIHTFELILFVVGDCFLFSLFWLWLLCLMVAVFKILHKMSITTRKECFALKNYREVKATAIFLIFVSDSGWLELSVLRERHSTLCLPVYAFQCTYFLWYVVSSRFLCSLVCC